MLSFNFFLDIYGLNCSQIANVLGIKRASVYEWSNGRRAIPPKHIYTLGELYNLNPEVLAGDLTKDKGLEIIESKRKSDLQTLDKVLL